MRRLIVLLLVLVTSPVLVSLHPGAATAASGGSQWARVSEDNAPIRQGCRRYFYDYELTPGPQGGTLELRLVGPTGTGLGGAYIDSSTDPRTGRRHWSLCQESLKPGVYKIHVTVTQRISQFESRTAQGRTVKFRLTQLR